MISWRVTNVWSLINFFLYCSDCQEQLDSDFEDEDSKLLSELLYKLELIWQLAEVMFVQRNASKLECNQTNFI